MPLYEYKGQLYDISTDDPAAAKQKILGHLGEAPAVEKPTEEVKPEAPKGSGNLATDVAKSIAATGTGIASSIPAALGAQWRQAGREIPGAPLDILQGLATGNILDKLQEHYGLKKKEEAVPETPVAEGIATLQEKLNKPLKEAAELATADMYIPGSRSLAEWGRKTVKELNESMSPETKEAIAKSQLSMPFNKEGKPVFGEDPSARGMGMQFLNVLSSFAPIFATSLITKDPSKVAAVGQAMSTGEGMNTAIDYINGISDADLAKSSPEFAALLEKHGPAEARRLFTAKVADQAGAAQGLVGRFGSEVAGKLLTGKFDNDLLKVFKTRAGMILGGTTGAMTEQGLSEMAEGLATDIGIDAHVPREIGADAFANLVWGALGGGPFGAYHGAKAKLEPGKVNAPIEETKAAAPTEIAPAPPLTSQGELFTPEQAPLQITPSERTVVSEAGTKTIPVEDEAVRAKQEASDTAQAKIADLTEQLKNATSRDEALAIRDEISKLKAAVQETPGAALDLLKQEHDDISRKRDAIAQIVPQLEEKRNEAKTLDEKKAITENINALVEQDNLLYLRQNELVKQGKPLAKGLTTTEETTQVPLNLEGKITEDDFARMGINKSNKSLREALIGKDLTNPEDHAFVVATLEKFAQGKTRSKELSSRVGAFVDELKQGAPSEPSQPREPVVSGVESGTSQPSVQLPSTTPQPTGGVTTPESGGLDGAGQIVGGPATGAEVPTGAQPSALATPAVAPTQPTPTPAPSTAGMSPEAQAMDAAYQASNPEAKPAKQGLFKKTINRWADSYHANNTLLAKMFAPFQNLFSFDDAFSNRMYGELMKLGKEGKITMEAAKEAILRSNITQALYKDQLGRDFVMNGGLVYNDAENRWYTKLDPKVNMNVFADHIRALADRIGQSTEWTLTRVERAYEANRIAEIRAKLSQTKAEITRAEKRIDALQSNRKRDKAEQKELDTKRKLLAQLKDDAQLYADQTRHISHTEAQQALNILKNNPEAQAALDIWNEMRRRAIKTLENTGVYSEQKAEQLLDSAAYVPFFREMGDEGITGVHARASGIRESMREHGLKGSERAVASITNNMMQWMQWSVAKAVSNQQIQVMIDSYKSVAPDEVRSGKGKDGNTFSVFEEGVQKFYHVADPMIAQAFMNMGSMGFGTFGVASKFKSFFSHAITRNPVFAVVQLPMDAWVAMSTSGVKSPFGLVKNIISEAAKTMAGTSEARETLKSMGTLPTHEYAAIQDSHIGGMQLGLESPTLFGKIKDVVLMKKVLRTLDRFSAASDNVLRQAVYEQLKAEGKSHLEASDVAADIANFRRQSANKYVQAISAVTPFFNAYAQILRVTLKTLAGTGISPKTRAEGLKTLASTSAKLAAFSALYAFLASGDEDYQKKNRKIRDRVFVIPGTGGASIPTRTDIFLLPKIAGEYGYNLLMHKEFTDARMATNAMSDAVKGSLMPPTTTLVTPIIGMAANHDFFHDRDIVNPTMRKRIPEEQYTKSTSELSKVIGSATGTSPLKWDYVLNGTLGTVMATTALATNSLIAGARGVPRPTMSTQDILSSIPSMGGVISKEDTSNALSDFYEVSKDVHKVADTIHEMAKTDKARSREFLNKKEENKKLYALEDAVKANEQELQNISRREAQILKATDKQMSADQKAAELKRLNQIRERILPRAMKLREKAGY